jgi:hypothetical protein
MRLFLIGLAALATPATPATANDDMPVESYHSVPSAPYSARTYVYFGHDDRWGPRVFSRDDGYFQGRGGGVSVANGRAVFDYDRDYPYDFPRNWGRNSDETQGEMVSREPECRIELVPDGRLGTAEVRVCR